VTEDFKRDMDLSIEDFRRRKTIGVIIRRGLKRFKKAVRMVIVLLRSGGILDTHKREFIDPVDLVYREFSTSLAPDKKSSDDDLFNPRYYRHSTYLNMLKSVQSFLQLNPISRKRNPAMLDTTMRALQIFKVFNTYPYEVQRELAATAYLEVFNPGKIIIKEEGLPERYYMVLCGQGLRAKSLRLPAGNVQLKIHGVISDGDDFGNENGILMANLNDEDSRYNIVQRRKECVFSKTQLSLLTLDRDDFLRIFHRRDSFKVLKEYLRDVVYFRHCNFAGLEADDLSVRYYRKNMLICCEDDLPRKVCIVRQGRAKVFRKIQNKDFIVAGTLEAGGGFGFNHDRSHKSQEIIDLDENSKRDENLFLISSGCEVIMMNWSIFERMRNLKVNANLTLLKEKSCILTDEEARSEINRSRTWGNYKSNLITEYTK